MGTAATVVVAGTTAGSEEAEAKRRRATDRPADQLTRNASFTLPQYQLTWLKRRAIREATGRVGMGVSASNALRRIIDRVIAEEAARTAARVAREKAQGGQRRQGGQRGQGGRTSGKEAAS